MPVVGAIPVSRPGQLRAPAASGAAAVTVVSAPAPKAPVKASCCGK